MSSLKNNFKYALFAQLITLCTSCIMSFFLPKFISLVDYSYWQLFVFYNMLIVFLNLGYSEGIYLKHAGINKNKIFNLNLSHHFSNICYLQCLFSIVIVCYALLIEDQDKKIIFYYIAFAVIVNNLSDFFCYIFQTINQIRLYSKIIIIYNSIFLFSLCSVLAISWFGDFVLDYRVVIFLYVGARFLGLLVGIWEAFRLGIFDIGLGKISLGTDKIYSGYQYIKIGMYLAVSNLCSFLILGINRIGIEAVWGLAAFGLISFSLQLCNFTIIFLKQIALVLFPHMRKLSIEENRKTYMFLSNKIDGYGPCILLFYIPIKVFILYWLPSYEVVCDYLVILLPICLYETKMQLLGVTFLKLYRKEKTLLKINLIALVFSIILFFVCAYIYPIFEMVVYSMVISIIFRSLITEYLIKKIIFQLNDMGKSIILLCFVICFNILFINFNLYVAGVIYGILSVFYIILFHSWLNFR